ncbi:MAG: hypothetical protein WBL61_04690 [Bryobacteraceae bacterium]
MLRITGRAFQFLLWISNFGAGCEETRPRAVVGKLKHALPITYPGLPKSSMPAYTGTGGRRRLVPPFSGAISIGEGFIEPRLIFYTVLAEVVHSRQVAILKMA